MLIALRWPRKAWFKKSIRLNIALEEVDQTNHIRKEIVQKYKATTDNVHHKPQVASGEME